jgi:predicted permease
MIFTQFSPHPHSQKLYEEVIDWGLIILPFALVLAVATLVQTHIARVRRRTEHWQYSFIVFVGIVVMVLIGVPFGPQNPIFEWLYNNVQVPLDATMFSLLAFFIASAAYRAFRARTFEATLLLVTAMIVMMGNVPVGDLIWNTVLSWIPLEDGASKARQWILDIPNLASRRGIILGVSLGVISQSIRIILGIERSYLGGGD